MLTNLQQIKKVRETLEKINKNIPVFFNITVYKKLDLVIIKTNKENRNTYLLTDKAKRIIKLDKSAIIKHFEQ